MVNEENDTYGIEEVELAFLFSRVSFSSDKSIKPWRKPELK